MVAGKLEGDAARGAASRILEILAAFSHDRPEMTVATLAEATGIPESTLFRLMRLLERYGMVAHSAVTGRYWPGLKAIQLGDIAAQQLRLQDEVQPILDDLQKACQETVNFSAFRGQFRVCLAKANTSLHLRDVVNVGEEYPIWLGASGKVIVAHWPEDQQQALAQEHFPASAERERFLASLAEARQGLAVTEGERVAGVKAYSAPVFRRDGSILGSVTISGPIFRLQGDAGRYGELVRMAARRLSEALARWN